MYLKRVASLGGTQVEYTKYREKLYLVTKVSFLTFFFFFFFFLGIRKLTLHRDLWIRGWTRGGWSICGSVLDTQCLIAAGESSSYRSVTLVALVPCPNPLCTEYVLQYRHWPTLKVTFLDNHSGKSHEDLKTEE